MLDPSYAARAAPPGSAAYFQMLFAPPAHRPALEAIFALRAEIRRAVARPAERDVARMRLAWWREEIPRLCRGQSRHPVTRALARAAPWLEDEFACLNDLLDAAALDLERSAYRHIGALAAYARADMAPVYRLAALLAPDGDARQRRMRLEAADALGCGVRLAEIVANPHEDALDERIYLPLEHLDHDEARAWLGGVASPGLEDALRATHAAAAARLAAARAALEHAPGDRPSAVALAWHRALLAAVERRGFPITGPRIDLRPLQKVYLSWRAARTAARLSRHPHG